MTKVCNEYKSFSKNVRNLYEFFKELEHTQLAIEYLKRRKTKTKKNLKEILDNTTREEMALVLATTLAKEIEGE